MSIYPVRFLDWFPYGDDRHEIALMICKISRCYACGSRIRFKKAVGHHSLPWGHGEIWCREKCLLSGKKAKKDRRLYNRLKRKCSSFIQAG